MKKSMLCEPGDIQKITSFTASNFSYNDPMLKECIVLATAMISSHTGRKFAHGTYTDYFTLPARNSPTIIMTTSIPVEDGSVMGKFSNTPDWQKPIDVEADLIETVDLDKGRFNVRYWADCYVHHGFKLTYRGGLAPKEVQTQGDDYEVLDSPYELIEACAVQASFIANRAMQNQIGVQSSGNGKVFTPKALAGVPPEVKQLLSGYRRPRYMGVY